MFSLFKKQISDKPIGHQLKTDMHSHLLPGIDDGAPDIETSLKLVKGLAGLGYKRLITTPHIMNEMYPNTPDNILSLRNELQYAVEAEGLDVEIKAAAEYYVDEFFEELLTSESLLTIHDQQVLVEQSMMQEYPRFKEVIYELRLKGYTPVIAHPERYVYYNERLHEYEWFRDAGCLLQVNLLSLQGYYGKMEKRLAEYLYNANMIDLYGTDCHHERHLARLSSFNTEAVVDELKENVVG